MDKSKLIKTLLVYIDSICLLAMIPNFIVSQRNHCIFSACQFALVESTLLSAENLFTLKTW